MRFRANRLLDRVFPRISLGMRICDALLLDYRSYLHETGWIRSWKESKPIDAKGKPVPWMNYTVIQFLRERLHADLNVFEFGSGHSTAFYAGLVNRVVSVEYDEQWYKSVKATAPSNVELIFQQQDVDGNYCRSISRTRLLFDVVVIDGRDRVNCIRQSIAALTERGVILLDDSLRERYREGFAVASDNGFRALSFEGLTPTAATLCRTTIFYRDANCLGI